MTILAKFLSMPAFSLAGLAILSATPAVFARDADQELPLVIEAKMPIYPIAARAARIQGTVTSKVTTDGEAVTALAVESGPPMLAKFTEENVRSWKFSKHKPTTFVSTFTYQLEGPGHCTLTNGSSTLELPLAARIVAKGVMTCDPARALGEERAVRDQANLADAARLGVAHLSRPGCGRRTPRRSCASAAQDVVGG